MEALKLIELNNNRPFCFQRKRYQHSTSPHYYNPKCSRGEQSKTWRLACRARTLSPQTAQEHTGHRSRCSGEGPSFSREDEP